MPNKKKPPFPPILSADDQMIWQSYVVNIKPLQGDIHKHAVSITPITVTQSSPRSSFDIPQSSVCHHNVSQVMPPVGNYPSVVPILSGKKIKQPLTIDGRLDLHGLTQIQAYNAILKFINAHYQYCSQTVIIITGKGFMRPHAYPHLSLAEALPMWLTQPPLKGYIRNFSIAHSKHGGRGAYYVYLKKPYNTYV